MNQDHHEKKAGVTIKLCFNSLRFSFCIAKPHFRYKRARRKGGKVRSGEGPESGFFMQSSTHETKALVELI
jgi:hypothetical protein